MRKAIGKKDRAIMAAESPRFIEGCVTGGVTEAEALHLWGLIEPFADYSFNRAHAACYAYIAYQTAWLKAHYPVEYMAALLTSVKDNKDAKPFYLHVARKMGIPVLIPDVNTSEIDFTPVEGSVRFGLSAIRGVGENVVEKIVEARSAQARSSPSTTSAQGRLHLSQQEDRRVADHGRRLRVRGSYPQGPRRGVRDDLPPSSSTSAIVRKHGQDSFFDIVEDVRLRSTRLPDLTRGASRRMYCS